MSVQFPYEDGDGPEAPALADAARKCAEAVAATPEYQTFMQVQEVLQQDEEAQRVIREFTAMQQRFDRGGIVFASTAKERQAYKKAEAAFSTNPRVLDLQDAQQKLVELLKQLNQIISDEYGTDFARAAAAGGGCCG